jgi:hypothetical protein
MGDQDECSIKHLGHGLASLILFDTWRNTVDYDYPWGLVTIPLLEKSLAAQWESVDMVRQELGNEEFYKLAISLPIADYLEFYLSGDWDYDRPEFLNN